MSTLRSFLPIIAVALLAIGPAEAKKVSPEQMYEFGLPLFDTSVSCSLSNLSGAKTCAGPFSGNDSNSVLDDVFGSGAWKEIVKVDGGASAEGLTVSGAGKSGTWSYSGNLGDFSQVMVALKGGPSFSLYELASGVTGGSWDTLGIVKGNGRAEPGLSHFTLYGRQGLGTSDPVNAPDPIPLPAAVWAMLAGLGGLFAMRRRRSAA